MPEDPALIVPYTGQEQEKACQPSSAVEEILKVVKANGNALDSMTPVSVVDLWLNREVQALNVIDSASPVSSADRFIPARNRVIPIRVYTPPVNPEQQQCDLKPLLLFVHGGGWTINSIGTYDPTIRYLCRALDAIIVSVGYRLAPEHPYPAGFHDVYLTLHWLARYAKDLGADPARIAIAGDSGGANIATAVTLLVKNPQKPSDVPVPPIAQFLFYPSTDLTRLDRSSYDQFGTGQDLEQPLGLASTSTSSNARQHASIHPPHGRL